jgi:uncharacterized radical SAM superfamily Fe-S cluster-containing enzyme
MLKCKNNYVDYCFFYVANGVPVYKMTQEERTFIVTFPKAFHAGFSYGVRTLLFKINAVKSVCIYL